MDEIEELSTPIQETMVGDVKISTVYIENLQDHMQTLLEAMGAGETPEALHLKQNRETSKGNRDMLDVRFQTPMFGPYYETMVFGGKYNGFLRRCNSVSQALEQHEDTVSTIKEDLAGDAG